MIDDIESELEVIVDAINTAKSDAAEAEGAIKAYMKQLKENFGLESVEAAEKFIKDLESELKAEEEKIMNEYDSLRDALGY